jgi:anti-sigma B factor antagonist
MGLVINETMGITVVLIEDAALLDPLHIEKVAEQLYELVDEKDRRKLVVDFRRVQHLSSQMIGVIIELHKKSLAIKGKLVVCGMLPNVRKGFMIMQLDKVLKIVDEETEAVRVLA